MTDSELAVIRQVRPVLTPFVAAAVLPELFALGLVERGTDGVIRLTADGVAAAGELMANPHMGPAPVLWCCSDMSAVLNR